MFDRLSGESHHVLEEARAEAGRLGHDFVGTEHLLLGLLDVGDPVAGALLKKSGVAAEKVRASVARAGALQQLQSDLPPLSLTARAKQVLAMAGKEADDLASRSVLPAHLLLGIIRQGTGVAALVLKDLGIDLVVLRQDLVAAVAALAAGGGDGGPGRPAGGVGLPGREGTALTEEHDDGQRDPLLVETQMAPPACPRCERLLPDHLVVTEISPHDPQPSQPPSSRLPRRGARSEGPVVVVVSCGACGYPLSVSR
jgi:ATP-dependent Clp protease ATP-binding subunit ClpC